MAKERRTWFNVHHVGMWPSTFTQVLYLIVQYITFFFFTLWIHLHSCWSTRLQQWYVPPSALCCVSSSLTIIPPSKTKNINLTFRHYREVREGVPLLANVSLWLVNSQVFTSRCMCHSWVLFRNTERTECCCHVILASAFVRKTRPPLIPFNNDTFLGFRLSDCRENKAIDGKKWTQSFSDKYTNGRLVLCEVFKCGKWL